MRAFLLFLLLTPPAIAAPKTVTLDSHKADIKNVFRLLADVGGVSVVFDDDVVGKVTVKLRRVRWRQAMEVIARSNHLAIEETGKILRIARRSTLDAQHAARLDGVVLRRKLGRLRTKIIPVNYGKASEMAVHLRALVSPRGTVAFDERTNTVIVRDVEDAAVFHR